MRDLAGTSSWRDMRVWAGGRLSSAIPSPAAGKPELLPSAASVTFSVCLQRPETPVTLQVLTADQTALAVTIDRNDRQVTVKRTTASQSTASTVASMFFPVDAPPFAAMVLDSLTRTALWAICALLGVLLIDATLALLGATRLYGSLVSLGARVVQALRPAQNGKARRWTSERIAEADVARPSAPATQLRRWWQALTASISPVALAALVVFFVYVVWIALVQYRALPHIYDASAYLFGAKIYATGHVSAPVPVAVDRFPGPFMVQQHGRWFPQYPPGTGLMLALGYVVGAPWLIEPILGTLALLAIGLMAGRLYDRRVATLTIVLGALSPFYSYLAASYLSHAVALFFLSWGFWALVRFAQRGPTWYLPLSAALFGMATLTRDLIALLFAAVVITGVLILSWRELRRDWPRWVLPGAAFIAVACCFVVLHLLFDLSLTGNALVTPRTLFSAGDRWGYGPGIGFYGQHTLAAGFVNVDELLTSLAIDLYGWPFYLTLCLLAMPFLVWRWRAPDWLMLAGAVVVIGSYVGYFYHGIYLGPRYLSEALPFILVLTARGIVALNEAGSAVSRAITSWLAATRGHTRPAAPRVSKLLVSVGTCALIAALVACNLLYYTPRQSVLYRNFSGLPAGRRIDTAALGHAPLHHAIVVTGDYMLYGYTLFALNDPLLRGDVLYAYAQTANDYQELRADFPGRAIYAILIAPSGAVSYVRVSP